MIFGKLISFGLFEVLIITSDNIRKTESSVVKKSCCLYKMITRYKF